MKNRCGWVTHDPLYLEYHDNEWGVPVHDDRLLFEFLILEGAQAGLSWITILKKRINYRKAFDNFNPEKIAKYNPGKTNRLLLNPGIIRNRLKIESTVKNAKAFLAIKKKFNSFDNFLWQFVNHKPIINRWENNSEVPTTSPEAKKMSSALKKLGFSFVGPTICYSFMQAVGMFNDHITSCFRHKEI
jgi:DNA-3-methyladenine glycosylase I